MCLQTFCANMRRLILATAVLFLLAKDTEGHGYFRSRIPNGHSVPSPCNSSAIWRGVGHLNPAGGGIRNEFGLDFAAAGYSWTRELCQKDSDGDGRTNGQELGDPDCTWTPGSLPTQLTGLSHPAVCEPVDSDSCKNKTEEGGLYSTQEQWLDHVCKSTSFNCPATEAADVEKQTFRIPPTQVPPKVTTYMCQTFRVDDVSRDRHMIATRAIINNTNVMHHMAVLGCSDPNTPIFNAPYECGMSPGYCCTSILSVWTLGLEGECFYDQAGIRVGPNGFQVLAMQYHWNNPMEESSYVDSSGMELFFTPNLRPYDSAVAMFGQVSIQVPPYSTRTDVTGECTETCMNSMVKNEGINITYAFNHMHYLGVSQTVEQYRNGRFVRNITNDVVYNYNSPRTYQLDSPLDVLPGDRIVTKCHFQSTRQNFTTFFGDATSDEMCFVFFTFYPAQNMPTPFCWAEGSWLSCDPATQNGCTKSMTSNFSDNFNTSELYHNITTRCKAFAPCTVECKEAILYARAANPCMADPERWNVLTQILSTDAHGKIFLAHLASCQVQMNVDEDTGTGKCDGTSGAIGNTVYPFASTIAPALLTLAALIG